MWLRRVLTCDDVVPHLELNPSPLRVGDGLDRPREPGNPRLVSSRLRSVCRVMYIPPRTSAYSSAVSPITVNVMVSYAPLYNQQPWYKLVLINLTRTKWVACKTESDTLVLCCLVSWPIAPPRTMDRPWAWMWIVVACKSFVVIVQMRKYNEKPYSFDLISMVLIHFFC